MNLPKCAQHNVASVSNRFLSARSRQVFWSVPQITTNSENINPAEEVFIKGVMRDQTRRVSHRCSSSFRYQNSLSIGAQDFFPPNDKPERLVTSLSGILVHHTSRSRYYTKGFPIW